MAMNGTATQAAKINSRAREAPGGDEEATASLKLGEFEDVPTLSLSEAKILIDAVKDSRRGKGGKMQETEITIKTEDYLDVFARFKRKENVAMVEKILGDAPLERFERSQLATLCCESAEEAKTLIPSLQAKMTDDELQRVLDDIAKLRNFVEP